MYCSDTQCITYAKKAGIDEQNFLDHLLVVKDLLQHRGSLLKSKKMQKIIAELSPETAQLIQLLAQMGKLDGTSLKNLLGRLVHDRLSPFVVRVAMWHERIKEWLITKFGDIQVEHADQPALWAQISGNGRSYKRNLDKDLEKMMW